VTVDELKDWNQISATNISIGTKLIVAKPESAKADSPSTVRRIIHKVRPGETLDKIAVAYKTTVGAILSWNRKNDLTVIHPGDQLTIFPGNR
jgi:membrane-bound lytic murein transglycosylase D